MDFKVELPSLVSKIGEPAFTVALPAPVTLPKPTPISVPVVLPTPVKLPAPIPIVPIPVNVPAQQKSIEVTKPKLKDIYLVPPTLPPPKKLNPVVTPEPTIVPVDKPVKEFISYSKKNMPDDSVRVPLNQQAVTEAITNWYPSKDKQGSEIWVCCFQQKDLTVSLVVRKINDLKYACTVNIYGDKCINCCQIKLADQETLERAMSTCCAGAGALYIIFEKLYTLGKEHYTSVEN